MAKANPFIAFRSIAEVGIGVSYSRFYKRINASPSYAYSIATCTYFVLCQLFIIKLSSTIYVSALYKSPIVPIDDITQQM
jgi:hypothetical protein